jgi:type IV secretory pathway VirB2 component (pilin)
MKNLNYKIISITLVTGYSLLVTISMAHAALVPCGTDKACTVCDFFVLIKNIVDFLTEAVAMPVAVIILIYGGLTLLTSGGSEDKIRKGKAALWQAVWGLIIVFAAWLIVDTIIKWFVAGNFQFLFGPWNAIPSGC